jgi:hypothetical protein
MRAATAFMAREHTGADGGGQNRSQQRCRRSPGLFQAMTFSFFVIVASSRPPGGWLRIWFAGTDT